MKIAVPNVGTLPYLKNSLKSRHGRQWLVLYLVFSFSVANLGVSLQARAECREGCDSSGFDAFLGEDALLNSGTGSTAVGYHALQNNSGNFNVGVGQNTLLASSGGENVATGSSALGNNTTGYNNTAIGGSNGKGGGSVLIPLQCFPGHRSLGEGGNDPTT